MNKLDKAMDTIESFIFHLLFPTAEFSIAIILIARWVCADVSDTATSFPWIALAMILGAVAAIARRD